jgi:hypothetical protein
MLRRNLFIVFLVAGEWMAFAGCRETGADSNARSAR